jgi:hypothetical protein
MDFGAKCKKGQFSGQTSHCFALNFNEDNPEVKGVDGILQTYNDSFNHLSLSAPTNFAGFINKCSEIANSPKVTQENQHYNILLILTDGVITDMADTVRAIKKGTKTPLSIIIIGVGEADFSQMEALDGDDNKSSKDVRFQVKLHCSYFSFREISYSSCHSVNSPTSTFLNWQKKLFVKFQVSLLAS